MKSNLKYLGELPRYALKLEWIKNKEVSLDEIFSMFHTKCSTSKELDLPFVQWFNDTYLSKLGRDFELKLDETEFTLIKTVSAVEDTWDDSDNQVLVETSHIETSSSIQEAEQRLRSMRHPDAVGEVVVTSSDIKMNKTTAESIKGQSKPGTSVMTGDDLDKQANLSKALSTKSSGVMLNNNAELVSTIPSTKDEQEKINNKFSSMSGRVKYLESSEDGKSLVITGDNLSESSEKKEVEVNTRKVNKNFQAHQMSDSTAIEILPQHISNAPSEIDAEKLINQCNNSTTLKVAKIYLDNVGNHKLIEKINDRLRRLPPGR